MQMKWTMEVAGRIPSYTVVSQSPPHAVDFMSSGGVKIEGGREFGGRLAIRSKKAC